MILSDNYKNTTNTTIIIVKKKQNEKDTPRLISGHVQLVELAGDLGHILK